MIPIAYLLDESTTIHAYLSLTPQKNDIGVQYFDEFKKLIAQEKMSDFHTIQISPSNALQVSFHSRNVDRNIVFKDSQNYQAFWKLLQDKNLIENTTTDPRTFSIKKNPLEQGGGSVINSIISTLFTGMSQQNNNSPENRAVDGITFGSISALSPSSQLTPFSKTDAQNADLSSVSFSSITIASDAVPVIFERLLKPKIPNEDYTNLKLQWKLTSPAQWDHDYKLRSFVHSLDKYLKNSSQFTYEEYKVLLFNVALGLYTQYFGSLKYSSQLMLLIEMLIRGLLASKLENGMFKLKKDNQMKSPEETENIIFAHLIPLWDLVLESKKCAVPQETMKIKTMLQTISPSTNSMLDDRKIKQLDFVMKDADLFFTQGRKIEEYLLLIFSSIANGDISLFRQNIIAISLVLLQDKLQVIPYDQKTKFEESYSTGLREIDVRTLLYNYERLNSNQNNTIL